jgi:hypothetical protein
MTPPSFRGNSVFSLSCQTGVNDPEQAQIVRARDGLALFKA